MSDIFMANQCDCELCIYTEMCKWKEERNGQECSYMQKSYCDYCVYWDSENGTCRHANREKQMRILDINKLLDKTFDDFCNCNGGEGWFEIDGEVYNTDAGYALEGMEIFIHLMKKRLAESEEA